MSRFPAAFTALVTFLFLQTNLWANADAVTCDTCFVLTVARYIQTSADDAEERPGGTVSLTSSDIELISDIDIGDQTVGLRFADFDLPQGAEIAEAYIQFGTDDETSSGFSNLTVRAENTDDAAPFTATNYNLSNRNLTDNAVSWLPGGWLTAGERGQQQRTPDLKDLVQEVVNRPGWSAGNAMSFSFTGSGRRIAAAYDLDPARAAELVVKINYPAAENLLENVFINEVMPSNTQIFDEYQEADDWLEIYNGGATPLFLGGLYLTDDPTDLQKWQITESPLLLPGGFALIWADDTPEQGGLHAPFKLTSGGEFLAIVQELNDELHILDSLTFPAVPQNVSYGSANDGQAERVFFGESSPRSSNNGQPQFFNEAVLFSENSGLFAGSIDLAMSVNDPAATIRYTLDGSTPTAADFLYTSPLLLDETTTVQAKAFKPGFAGAALTSAFFVIDENSEIAVLHIQSDPDNFWSDETGIYVAGTNGALDYCNDNIRNWNRDWERPCRVTLIEPENAGGFQIDAGMKIGGACSRNLKMKSLNIFLRGGIYGDEVLEYPLFANSDLTDFRRFKVRNGGTDWIEMLFRDGMNSLLLENTVDIDLLDYRPVRVYLNGEYWGIYGIREMFNKYYVESHHGADPDNVDILSDPYGPGSFVREGDFVRYDEMTDFLAANSLSSPAAYVAMREFVDMNEYINYHIAQIYLANYDQPGNNVRIWRDRDGGKFRWMLFDTDASAGWESWGNNVAQPNHNTLAHMLNTQNIGGVPGFPQWPNGPESTYLFRKMMESQAFEDEFVQRTCTFRELIFAPERVLPMVDAMENLLLPEMQRHIARWNGNDELGEGTPSAGFVVGWQDKIDNYRSFFSNRDFHLPLIFKNTLDLDNRFDLTFNYDANTDGKVVLHENEMPIPFDYTGEYFQNIPLRIKAIPDAGYFFSHWEETGDTNAETTFTSNADATLTPIFTDTEPVNTENFTSTTLEIFPNPTQNYVEVRADIFASVPVKLCIYNSLGQLVREKKMTGFGNNTSNRIFIGKQPAGVYWLTLTGAGQKMTTGRFMVK